MILTHIDNFNIAGDDDFVEMILDNIERELTISKYKVELSSRPVSGNLMILISFYLVPLFFIT